MSDLLFWQYIAIAAVFVWGGFVRTGLGFGGGALTLPLLLLMVDDPVVFLPIIAVHLLVFAFLTVGTRMDLVDWRYVARVLLVILPFKLAGVVGLLNLPGNVLTAMVYVITAFYAVSYLVGIEFKSKSRVMDTALLAAGGYISGTSLIGAPLIIAVVVRYVARENLRETLFVLWVVLVVIKIAAFLWTGTDMQWVHQLWLFPAAFVGHLLGMRFHRHLGRVAPQTFLRVVGAALLAITVVGLGNAAMSILGDDGAVPEVLESGEANRHS